MTLIVDREISVFLDNSLGWGTSGEEPEPSLGWGSGARSYLFTRPERVITCTKVVDLPGALAALEEGVAAGYYAAGWIAYEAGYGFEPCLAPLVPQTGGAPLLWFGLFARRQTLDPGQREAYWAARAGGAFETSEPALDLDEAAYSAVVGRIKDYLAAGDVYQINHTLKYHYSLTGDVAAYYAALRPSQPVAYGGFIQSPQRAILCFSPELFLRRRAGMLYGRPMKGTAPRGRTVREDAEQAAWLRHDEKSRAENLMILDLLRNDFGRLADTGGVEVTGLYEIETYRSLLQMTSGVRARLRPGLGLAAIIASLFPCGSITGAPKIRAMEIIRELEPRPRGVYTGAIGMIEPGGDFVFNVPIRTIAIAPDGAAELGVGAGIVADSSARDEFAECRLKGRFATAPQPAFALIETLLWRAPGGYWLLEGHLERLAGSAHYFGHAWDRAAVCDALAQTADGLDDRRCWRVRLLHSVSGAVSVTATPLEQEPGAEEQRPASIMLADQSTSSDDIYLFHKTTNRAVYDAAYVRAVAAGHIDVVFTNQRGEITEGARNTIFAEIDGVLYTPPVDCGLLPGVMRDYVLAAGKPEAREKILTPAELARAEKLYLANAVRGLRPVVLHPRS